MTPRWLRMKQACDYSGLCRNTIKRMIADGILSGDTTPGGHWRVDRESIDAWFQRTEEKAAMISRSVRV